MDVVHPHCAGLDVHKKTVVASIIVPREGGGLYRETRTFETMTGELLALSDWLLEKRVTHAAMESTGEYWKPIFNILEHSFDILLVNAQHIKTVPGRKTDVKDAEWIAELLRFGLLKASFVPPEGQRELRELTRFRSTFIQERATLVNRLQKVLESANIKLASVVSDVNGVSGKAILKALVEGTSKPEDMAELAKGRLKEKREFLVRSLEGRVKPHHRFLLSELLCQLESLDESIHRFDQQIEEYCRPFEESVVLVDTIPGVARKVAEVIISEIGTNMSCFPTADHLASWAGVAPGNNESAGKRLSGRTTKGNRALVSALTQAAHAAARSKHTYLSAQFHRLAGRRGKKRAIMAVSHSILVIAYHLIKSKEPYHDLGPDFLDKRKSQATAKRLIQRLHEMGYAINLDLSATVAA
jgi:transposase